MRVRAPLAGIGAAIVLIGGLFTVAAQPRTSCAIAEPNARGRTSLQRFVFARAGARGLELDLLRPSTRGPHPLVVLLHGGAWRRGNRGAMSSSMYAFVAQGYAAASVDYRLANAPADVFPSPISDVRCAIRRLRNHAAELDLDPDRFAVVGFSAGAHLAGLVATGADVAALDDGSCPETEGSPAVQAAVALYGLFDLRPSVELGRASEDAIRNFLGVLRRDNVRRASLASPIAHLDAHDPPMLLVHGVRDDIVSIEQSRAMRTALEHTGVPGELVEVPNGGHGFGLFPDRRGEDNRVACVTLAFLARALRPVWPPIEWTVSHPLAPWLPEPGANVTADAP